MEKWAKKLNSKKDYMPVVQQPRIETPQVMPTKVDVVSDICFSMLEKKDRPATSTLTAVTHVPYHSDSEDEDQAALKSAAAASSFNENDLVDFEKLTCLLCKRAFQSVDILSKHMKQSNLHKENLQKYKLQNGILDMNSSGAAANINALR
jgi:RNA-binding protein 5/10